MARWLAGWLANKEHRPWVAPCNGHLGEPVYARLMHALPARGAEGAGGPPTLSAASELRACEQRRTSCCPRLLFARRWRPRCDPRASRRPRSPLRWGCRSPRRRSRAAGALPRVPRPTQRVAASHPRRRAARRQSQSRSPPPLPPRRAARRPPPHPQQGPQRGFLLRLRRPAGRSSQPCRLGPGDVGRGCPSRAPSRPGRCCRCARASAEGRGRAWGRGAQGRRAALEAREGAPCGREAAHGCCAAVGCWANARVHAW